MHVLKGNPTGDRAGQGDGRSGVLHGVFGPQQLYQTFRGTGGALKFTPYLGQRRDPACHHHGIDHELHQATGGHLVGTHIPRAHPQNAHDAGKYQKDHNNRHQRAGLDPTLRRIIGRLGHLCELRLAGGLVGKGLHGLHRAQTLGRIARACRDPVLIFTAQHPQAPPQNKDRHNYRRYDQQHHRRQLGRGEQHQHQPTGHDQHIAQRDGHGRPDHRQDQRGVRGDPAQHLAGHQVLVERRAHRDHAIEHRLADIGNDPFAKARHQRIAQPRADSQKGRDDQGGNEVLVKQFGLAGAEVIDHAAHGQRQRQRDHRREHQRQNGRDHQPAIGCKKRQQRTQGPQLTRFFAFFGAGAGRRGTCHEISFGVLPCHRPHIARGQGLHP